MKHLTRIVSVLLLAALINIFATRVAQGDQNGFMASRWTGAWGSDGPIRTGDLNGDGKTDVFMWRNSDKSWTVNLSNGDGFTAQRWTGAWGSDGPIFTGDLNEDGKTDVFMWRDVDKSWTVNLSTGTGFIAQRWTGGWGSDGPIFTGNLNDDGKTDVFMWRNIDKSWIVNLSTGSGFIAQKWGGAWGSDGPIFTGFLNDDTKTDVFMWRDADKSWTVNLSTGSGFIAQKWTGAWGSDGPIRVADLTGDGKSDVFMWRAVDNSWTVNISTGTGFIAQRWVGACGIGPVVIGRFNDDRLFDIVVWRDDLKKWMTNLSLGGAFNMQQWTGAWGSDGPIQIGDLNGDGKSDVFMWRDIDKSWTVNLSVPVVAGPASTIPGCGNPNWQTLGPHTLKNEQQYLACGGRIDAIAISSDYDGKGHPAMFIGSPGGGIMRWSMDFPSSSSPSWEALTDHIPFVTPDTARIGINTISSIAVDPVRPRTIYASKGGAPLSLLKSDDGGNSWSIVGNGQFDAANAINAVTIDTSGRIYVAATPGFFVSENNGLTFTNIAPMNLSTASFEDTVVYADPEFRVFAALIDPAQTKNASGVWQVTPALETYQWRKVPFTLRDMNNVAFNSMSISHVKMAATPGVGVVTSFTLNSNPGLLNVFQLVNTQGPYRGLPKWFTAEQFFTQNGYVMGVALGEDGRTYGGGIGLAQADKRGKVLNLQSQFNNVHVDEHVLAAYGGKIYAGTDGGLYRFTPQAGVLGGASPVSWESLNSPSLENFLTESVAYNPQDAFDVLAGHQDNGINHLSRGDWRWLNNSNESDTVFFDPHPHEKSIAYAYDTLFGFFKSYDGGTTLSKQLIFPALDIPNFIISFHPTDENRFIINFPVAGNEFTVKETRDGWENATKTGDLAPPIKGLGCPTALSYAGKYIYVAAAGNIFQFDGQKWNKVFTNNSRIVSIVVDRDNPNAIYFATDSNASARIFRKPDQSNRLPWTEDMGGDLQNLTGPGLIAAVSKLALIPNGPGRSPILYAATLLGMFRTARVNGNNTIWAPMGVGFPDSPISDLQVNAENRMIYVATYGRGIWYTLDLQ